MSQSGGVGRSLASQELWAENGEDAILRAGAILRFAYVLAV